MKFDFQATLVVTVMLPWQQAALHLHVCQVQVVLPWEREVNMCVNVRKDLLATTVKTTLMTVLMQTVRNIKFVLT